jgi:hypothetical protein
MPESGLTTAESGISFFEMVGTAGFEEVPIKFDNPLIYRLFLQFQPVSSIRNKRNKRNNRNSVEKKEYKNGTVIQR